MSASDDPHVGDTSPHDWTYISEGGSTIVFSYSGPPHPHFDGTALRLRKGPVPTHDEPEKYELPPLDEPDDPTIVFQRTVIERLVPPAFLPRLDAVHVERRWLQELSALVEPHRPLERRARDRIDVAKAKAVLATDLVGGKGWAVEIKVRPSNCCSHPCRSILISILDPPLPQSLIVLNGRSAPCSPSGASSPRRRTSRTRRARRRRGRAASACTRT